MTAICPGSFDPITVGHIDLIARSSKLFERVVIAVLANSAKNLLFSADERVDMIKASTADLTNVEVITFDGLLADLASQYMPAVLVKGVRTTFDFEYELQMSAINRGLNPELDTIFIPCDPAYSHVSSTVVRELALHGGDISFYVTASVGQAVKNKFKNHD